MGVYLCDSVSAVMQTVKGVLVKDKSDSSWTFEYNGARANVRILPGCCGILLIYKISGKERDALRLIKVICGAARKTNFGMVIMSLLTASPVRKILPPEWVATDFKNPRTRNDVSLLTYKPVVKVKPQPANRYHEDN